MKNNIYILDLSLDDIGDIEEFIEENEDRYFKINKGKIDKVSELRNVIDTVCQNNKKNIVLHIIGHGVVNKEKTNSIGIEFLPWNEFGNQICILKKHVESLYINMLGVCFSSDFVESCNCFDKIWYTTKEAKSIYVPTRLYDVNYINDFDAYIDDFDVNGEFGFKLKENNIKIDR